MNKLMVTARTLANCLLVLTFVAAAAGCAGAPTRNPPPMELVNQVGVPGLPEARFWNDEWPGFSVERLQTFTDDDFRQNFPATYDTPHNYLAISGGGSNGAFGAGLLVGWTESGTRPEFTMVTGISTGALTAPFAFLGSEYDDKLKDVYTTISTKDVARKRNIISAAFSDSMIDTRPLRSLIERTINTDVIRAIAREHERGRRLFVGTLNIDAGRSVIWNIGAIAASDYPRKVGLIHDVLQASSAIPVAFPPVEIPVETNGITYQEMHVDGGTGSQVFVYPAAVDWKEIVEKLKVQGEPKVFIIRNSFLDPQYASVKRSLLPIAGRTIDSLIRTQGIGDLYQIYTLCLRDGNDFNLAYIPASFTEKSAEAFDPVYMGKLFDRGYEMARTGYQWKKWPPGLHVSTVNKD